MAFSRLAERFKISQYAYAHRGLWTQNGPPENSIEAFKAAAAQGLGIEFDVRPTADGVPIVFHDPALERMTHQTGSIERLHSHDLKAIKLNGGSHIPTLEMLLDIWPSKTPLLCELKIDGNTDPVGFTHEVAAMLNEYSGPAAMMSFSRSAVAAIPDAIMRGQLISPSAKTNGVDLAATPLVDVDYLACHVSDTKNASLQAARLTCPLVTWTVTDLDTCAALAPYTDSQIFEAFDPTLAKRHIVNT
jgi:glycerophosphoryl diester phosphodiesterase